MFSPFNIVTVVFFKHSFSLIIICTIFDHFLNDSQDTYYSTNFLLENDILNIMDLYLNWFYMDNYEEKNSNGKYQFMIHYIRLRTIFTVIIF